MLNQNYIFNKYYGDTAARVINFLMGRVEVTRKEIMHEKCEGLEDRLGSESGEVIPDRRTDTNKSLIDVWFEEQYVIWSGTQ